MYQALYRKYRPQVFSDVIGQEHITSTLANEIRENKLSHAYLFTGSRGTGKTTCARILAKSVNCLNPVDGNPCNECEICRGIDNGSVLDVIEIDAASNRGVDNIRDLRDEANFTPSRAKYRIYIIDEVHMLTIEAFNALLKTLEEPPEHVKFILATTEIHKLPATILSRCQRFDFRRIPPEDIADRLQKVSSLEGLTLEHEAAMLIARIADGAMRDALSLLDQCASVQKNIDSEAVSRIAGMTGKLYLYNLTDAIRNHDCSIALKMIDELHNSSCDMERLCTEMINHFRNLLVAKTVSNPEELIVCTSNELEKIKNQSAGFTLEAILYSLRCLEDTVGNMKRGVNRRVETEMALIRLCSPKLDESNKALLSRIAKLENALATGSFTPANRIQAETTSSDGADLTEKAERESSAENTAKEEASPAISENSVSERAEENSAPVSPANTSDIPFAPWPDVLKVLGETSKPLAGLLAGTSAILRGDCVGIRSNNAALGKFIKENSYRNTILQAIYDVTGQKYRLAIARGDAGVKNTAVKTDPLDGLISKINNSDINFNIE